MNGLNGELNFSKPLETKKGENVKFLTRLKVSEYPYVVVVTTSTGDEKIINCNTFGATKTSADYIRNRRRITTRWINIYNHGGVYSTKLFFLSENDALVQRVDGCVSTIKIEFEDYEG